MERHIYIYGEVGWEVNAASVQDQINAPGDYDSVVVHISSPGGGVFEGWTIGNIIAGLNVPTTAQIEGLCASIATYIALKCESVEMADTARFMIHNPSTFIEGDSEKILQGAEQLDKIKDDLVRLYVNKTGLPEDEVSKLMDDETFFDAEEAQSKGFIDSIIEPVKAVAKFDIKMKKAEKDSLLDKMFNSIKELRNEVKAALGEPKNVTVELADGSSVWVESEDGDFTGKEVFMVEDGEVTETPAPNGRHDLTDGRVMVVEDGVITSIEDEPEDKMAERVAELEAENANLLEEVKNLKETIQNTGEMVTQLEEEAKNLKKLTAVDTSKPRKAVMQPSNKFNNSSEPSGMDAWAEQFKTKILRNNG